MDNKITFELENLEGCQFLVDYENMIAYEIWYGNNSLKIDKLNKMDYRNLIEQLPMR